MISRILSRTFLALAVVVLAFAVAVPAQASIMLTAPTGNPIMKPGQKVRSTWAGSCPSGKLCGLWKWTETDFGANLAVGMSQTPTELNGVWTLDDGKQIGDSWSTATKTTHMFELNKGATPGQWYMVASWNECAPMQEGDVNLDDCTIARSGLKPFRVRAMIGLPGNPARLDHQSTNGRRSLFMRTTFGCNATAPKYRGNLLVQKRVRVGGRFVWRTQLTKMNVPTRRNDLHTKCTVSHTWPLPAGTTTLRYRWSLRSINVSPAALPWTRTSAPFQATRG